MAILTQSLAESYQTFLEVSLLRKFVKMIVYNISGSVLRGQHTAARTVLFRGKGNINIDIYNFQLYTLAVIISGSINKFRELKCISTISMIK